MISLTFGVEGTWLGETYDHEKFSRVHGTPQTGFLGLGSLTFTKSLHMNSTLVGSPVMVRSFSAERFGGGVRYTLGCLSFRRAVPCGSMFMQTHFLDDKPTGRNRDPATLEILPSRPHDGHGHGHGHQTTPTGCFILRASSLSVTAPQGGGDGEEETHR